MNHPDLSLERQRNAAYIEHLRNRITAVPVVSVARSQLWTGSGLPRIPGGLDGLHPLVGRVELTDDDPDLGRSFYIGPRRHDGDIQVICWAAPVARAFFQPDGRHGLDADVTALRTFGITELELSSADDEVLRLSGVPPFAESGLAVPAPERRGSARRRRSSADAPPTTQQDTARTVAPTPPSAPASSDSRSADLATAGMRAAGAVLRRLAAPRQRQLESVLATLQPDQHNLVTRPADASLILQGHPGTGKTIIAAYRAGFLVTPDSPDAGGAGLDSVLLVGPTAGYVNHVSALLAPLDPHQKVFATDLTTFMATALGAKTTWGGRLNGELDKVDASARILTEKTVRLLTTTGDLQRGERTPRRDLHLIYETLRANGKADAALTFHQDQIEWLGRLPPFDHAMKLRRYLPLLTQCHLSHGRVRATDQFEHIVVDEAQDVSPIEWGILDQYLRSGGSWTVVGDLNQRRADTSYTNWTDISQHLGLCNDTDGFAPIVVERGYRSTTPILRYAERLLPPHARGGRSVQVDGAPVDPQYVRSSSALASEAIKKASALVAKHPHGSVAIITVDPATLIQHMGRGGWRRNRKLVHVWRKDAISLALYSPEDARGLEFDAVVVVEPSAFPSNLGRHGQLYTSLTRANRELAVIWHRPMPEPLKRDARTNRSRSPAAPSAPRKAPHLREATT